MRERGLRIALTVEKYREKQTEVHTYIRYETRTFWTKSCTGFLIAIVLDLIDAEAITCHLMVLVKSRRVLYDDVYSVVCVCHK